ncbi:MAG: hypothetical protein CEO21_201 [Microgenomates group bacterium Gr01-1014_80]|nr:MAG: hypothetical protein CEO21_201 [Microgenomates group bacterium Gr01-1014_80]
MNLENPKLHIAGLVIVGLGLLAISIFSSSPSNKKSSNIPTIPIQEYKPEITATPGWSIYKGNGYSINYPLIMTVWENQISGGGTSLIFNPPKNLNFRMRLDIISKNRTSPESSSELFRVFKYQESDIQLSGRSAKKFTGSLKIKPQTKQETAVIFEDSINVYKMQLTYDAPTRNAEIDNLYEQIIKTFNML